MSDFDIYVVRPPRHEDNRVRTRGWISLDADLETARTLVRTVLNGDGNAYVVPARYRVPRVTEAEARQTAEDLRQQLINAGERIAELSEAIDDLLWWTFLADDLDAIDRHFVPGNVRIAIDKLDGTLRTEEQFQAWLKLSPLRSESDQ